MLYGNCLFEGKVFLAGMMVLLSFFTLSDAAEEARTGGEKVVLKADSTEAVQRPGAGKALSQADSAAAGRDSSSAASEDSSGVSKEEGRAEKDLVVINLEGGGRIIMELLQEDAPLTIERFTELVNKDFYDGLEFHRVESYLVQTGDREHQYSPVTGEMFSQYLRHEEGMVGMARRPDDYDSATTQFYICKKELSSLNGEYTLFARVIEGMDLVHEIEEGDRIESVEFKKPE